MPFKSKKQWRAAFGGHIPGISKKGAKEWADKTQGGYKGLPPAKFERTHDVHLDEMSPKQADKVRNDESKTQSVTPDTGAPAFMSDNAKRWYAKLAVVEGPERIRIMAKKRKAKKSLVVPRHRCKTRVRSAITPSDLLVKGGYGFHGRVSPLQQVNPRGSSPRWETPKMPDYQYIYHQPADSNTVKQEREADANRLRADAEKNSGKFSILGMSAMMPEPDLRYDGTEYMPTSIKLVHVPRPGAVGAQDRAQAGTTPYENTAPPMSQSPKLIQDRRPNTDKDSNYRNKERRVNPRKRR